MALQEIETFAVQHCDYTESWLTQYLVFTHYASYYITGIFFVLGLRVKELYLLCVSLGLSVSWFINYLLLAAIQSPVPNGTCGLYAFWCDDPATPDTPCQASPWQLMYTHTQVEHCVSCSSPAFEVQQMTFLVVTLYTYITTWHAPQFHILYHVSAIAWYALIVYAHSYIGFNAASHIALGATIGAIVAYVWAQIVFTVLYPRFDVIMSWRVIRWTGPYQDSLARSYKPVSGDPVPLIPVSTQRRQVGYGLSV